MEKNITVAITRREFITFTLGAAATAAVVAGWGTHLLRPKTDMLELSQLLRELSPPASIKFAIINEGLDTQKFINEFYENLQAGLQDSPLVKSVVETLIENDFRANQVIYIQGWSLSHTEIALCLLS